MIVHHFSTFPYGGAAVAARRLHRALLQNQVSSHFYYSHDDRPIASKPKSDPHCTPLPVSSTPTKSWLNPVSRHMEKHRFRRITEYFNRHLQGRSSSAETFSSAEQLEGVRLQSEQLDADILHLHWIAYMADFPSFFRSIPANRSVVWTMHDMNPFTGGCHFDSGCNAFQSGCGNCPQLSNPTLHDLSGHSWKVKQRAYQGHALHVVGPSQWILKQAKQSEVWPEGTTFTQIHYGIDGRVYHPLSKAEARARLGLDPQACLVGFGADNLSNPRKGLAYLEGALAGSTRTGSSLQALVFGSGDLDSDRLNVRRTTRLGFVEATEDQVLAYSACDFFVVPSLEDNQPQMALEAMACGVPVIGFRSGGLPEMISDGIDGLLVERANVEALRAAIEWMMDHSESRQLMARRARTAALRDFDQQTQTQKYLELYRQVQGLAQIKSSRRVA